MKRFCRGSSRKNISSNAHPMSNFQVFKGYNNSNKLRISNELEFRKTVNPKCLLKYIQTDYFIESLAEKTLYLSSPSKWDDPFETKYMDSLDLIKDQCEKDKETLKNFSVFATCFKRKDNNKESNEHVGWNSYLHEGESVVRLEIDTYKLCDALLDSHFENGTLYLSSMNYQERKNIVKPTKIGYDISKESNDYRLQDLYIKNFSLKQKAYEYEDEIRLSLISDNCHIEDHVLLNNFDWNKVIISITLQPLNKKYLSFKESLEKNISTYQQIRYWINKDITLYRSNLYDSNEIEMVTEI